MQGYKRLSSSPYKGVSELGGQLQFGIAEAFC
jgi:hypothetical protein